MQDLIVDSKIDMTKFAHSLVSNGLLQWSGRSAIPYVGDDVTPSFSPRKWEGGRVIGYFHQDGYLGLIIRVRDGYTQEYKDLNPSLETRLFGAEVKPL